MHIQIADHLLIPVQRVGYQFPEPGLYRYVITEENENYTAFCTIGDLPGKNTNKAEFVLGEDTRVDFVNTLDLVIPTGADAGSCVTAALIFAAALAGAYFMLRRKEQDSD